MMSYTYDKEALAAAQRAVIELDFSEENEQLREIDRRIEDAKRAEHDARQRIDAINGYDAKADHQEVSRLADALIHGDADTMPSQVHSNEQRKAEKEALINARRELSLRIANMESEKTEVRHSARQKVAQALEPLSAMVVERARKRASDLAESFAEMKVITSATGGNRLTVEAAHEAVLALRQDNGLLSREKSNIDVPKEIVDALAPLRDAGDVLPSSKYPQVSSIGI